jgi:hypothetical protein
VEDFPFPLGSQTVPWPHLLASHSNSSQQLNPNGYLTKSVLVLLIISQHGRHRKHSSCVAVKLMISNGMTYSIVACAAICTDCTENTTPLLLFRGCCLIMAGCCDSSSCLEWIWDNTVRLIQMHPVLTQGICTIFMDQLPMSNVFRKVDIVLASNS